MQYDCYFCHTKTIENLINKFNPATDVAEDMVFAINDLLGNNRYLSNPKLATLIHRIAKNHLANKDLYAEEKNSASQVLLNDYELWKHYVQQSEHPFDTAAKLAVVGNIIDYGAHSLNGDLTSQIKSLLERPLAIDKRIELKKAIEKADKILYLGDNAGEIVFDKLFIETFNHPKIFYATRGKAVINDITPNDAKFVGLDKTCHIISNGYDAPSTLLEYCSLEFLKSYHKADLIISKGQGNFEGLMDEKHPNTFFMLIAKCKPMGQLLNVDAGSMVITKLK